MLKEFKNDIAKMYSLMGRMDKHMTLNEAQCFDEYLLNEGSNSHTFTYDLEKVDDPNSKGRIVSVTFKPLLIQDAKKLSTIEPFISDEGRHSVEKLNGSGGFASFTFYRNIVANKKYQKSNDGQTQQTSSTPDSSVNPLLAMAGLTEAINIGAGIANLMKQTNQQAQNQVSSSSPNAGDTMYSILKKCFDTVYNFLSSTGNYDQKSLDSISDFDKVYASYLSQPVVNDTVYPDKTEDEITKEVKDALRSGNIGSYLNGQYNALDVESIIFGNVLSSSNIKRILHRASQYGIDQNSGRLDRLYGSEEWRHFGRRVKQDPDYPFPVEVPMVGTHGSKIGGGTLAHYNTFNKVGANERYRLRNLYPLEDTELIDPNDSNDYFEATPGINSVLTGGLNQAAQDYKKGVEDEISDALTPEELQTIAECETPEGKAKIFNRSLIEYCAKNSASYGGCVNDIENSSSPVRDFLDNLLAIGKKSAQIQRIANPTIVDVVSLLIQYGISCYTVGSDLLKCNYIYNLGSEWDKNVLETVTTITTICNYIHHNLNARYNGLRKKIQNIASTNALNLGQGQTTPSPQPATSDSTTQVSENILSDLLKELLNE